MSLCARGSRSSRVKNAIFVLVYSSSHRRTGKQQQIIQMGSPCCVRQRPATTQDALRQGSCSRASKCANKARSIAQGPYYPPRMSGRNQKVMIPPIVRAIHAQSRFADSRMPSSASYKKACLSAYGCMSRLTRVSKARFAALTNS